MGVEEIKCPVCGYSAMYVSVGNKGKIKTDSVAMSRVCENFGSGDQGLQCKHFEEELLRPRSGR